MARTIELYIHPNKLQGPYAALWRKFMEARSPEDLPYGTRTVVVQFESGKLEEVFRVTLDHFGFRLVFQDELPARMKDFPPDIIYKTVITDRVRDSARPLKECAGSRGKQGGSRCAWRVTARDSHYWEIVVQATNFALAIRIFEEVRTGSHAGGIWSVSPWAAVGL